MKNKSIKTNISKSSTKIDKGKIFVAFGGGIHASYHRSKIKNLNTVLSIIVRYYNRYMNAQKLQNRADMSDFAYTFTIYCMSLKDWGRKLFDTETPYKFENTLDWKIIRDLANGIKHFYLKEPSLPLDSANNSGPLALAFEYDYKTKSEILICHFSLDGEIIKINFQDIAKNILEDCIKFVRTLENDVNIS